MKVLLRTLFYVSISGALATTTVLLKIADLILTAIYNCLTKIYRSNDRLNEKGA